jgi:hypothetical protein
LINKKSCGRERERGEKIENLSSLSLIKLLRVITPKNVYKREERGEGYRNLSLPFKKRWIRRGRECVGWLGHTRTDIDPSSTTAYNSHCSFTAHLKISRPSLSSLFFPHEIRSGGDEQERKEFNCAQKSRRLLLGISHLHDYLRHKVPLSFLPRQQHHHYPN